MERIKVAYICHYSTPEIRSHLFLRPFWWGNFLRSIKGVPKLFYTDAGSWNADFIKAFENRNDVDCHVIMSHIGMMKMKQQFIMEGVSYTVLQEKENVWQKVRKTLLRTRVKEDYEYYTDKIIEQVGVINPDVVILCGAENPNYSGSVLKIKDHPIFVILQTWLNSPRRIAMGVGNEERRKLENKIFEHASYFATFDVEAANYIKQKNSAARFFNLMFPSSLPIIPSVEKKQYDFTFFANGLTKNKGIEDAIIAFGLVCQNHPKATFNVIGDCDQDYMSYLLELVEKNGIVKNVNFCGHFPRKEDAICEVMKARVAVLPGITAPFNSTVRETMFMGIPTIVYDNSVMRNVNKNEQNLLTAEIENVDDLGAKMLYALEQPEEMTRLAKRAKQYAENHFSVEAVGRILIEDIKSVVEHANHRRMIRKDLLLEYN